MAVAGHDEECVLVPLIIGISGATRSGKSTLARALSACWPEDAARVLAGDTWFDKKKIKGELGGNWETPAGIKWDDMLQAVKDAAEELKRTAASGRGAVIVDSFLLYHDERLRKLLDVRLFVDVPREVVYSRRMETAPVTERYFQDSLWPAYADYYGSRDD
eukprot:PLAT9622.1.p1 GENE.PLAT9622.1~~PLAT9622.1.p1  ORF type:complete len:161 (+),score=38.09 PLAT9622.1:68-550(+)